MCRLFPKDVAYRFFKDAAAQDDPLGAELKGDWPWTGPAKRPGTSFLVNHIELASGKRLQKTMEHIGTSLL